jgi:hypothetical protein
MTWGGQKDCAGMRSGFALFYYLRRRMRSSCAESWAWGCGVSRVCSLGATTRVCVLRVCVHAVTPKQYPVTVRLGGGSGFLAARRETARVVRLHRAACFLGSVQEGGPRVLLATSGWRGQGKLTDLFCFVCRAALEAGLARGSRAEAAIYSK